MSLFEERRAEALVKRDVRAAVIILLFLVALALLISLNEVSLAPVHYDEYLLRSSSAAAVYDPACSMNYPGTWLFNPRLDCNYAKMTSIVMGQSVNVNDNYTQMADGENTTASKVVAKGLFIRVELPKDLQQSDSPFSRYVITNAQLILRTLSTQNRSDSTTVDWIVGYGVCDPLNKVVSHNPRNDPAVVANWTSSTPPDNLPCVLYDKDIQPTNNGVFTDTTNLPGLSSVPLDLRNTMIYARQNNLHSFTEVVVLIPHVNGSWGTHHLPKEKKCIADATTSSEAAGCLADYQLQVGLPEFRAGNNGFLAPRLVVDYSEQMTSAGLAVSAIATTTLPIIGSILIALPWGAKKTEKQK